MQRAVERRLASAKRAEEFAAAREKPYPPKPNYGSLTPEGGYPA
jgi:hypothetical protein